MRVRSKEIIDRRRAEVLASIYHVVARKSIAHITIRQIAAEAGISPGLLHHYFGNKENLLHELFAWLGQLMLREPATAQGAAPDSIAAEQMLGLIRNEIERAIEDRDAVQLFFDFWVQGAAIPAMRAQVGTLLHLYRQRFIPVARKMVAEDPDRFQGTSAEGLAGVAASFVQGCAVQVMADHDGFNIDAHLATAEALLMPALVV